MTFPATVVTHNAKMSIVAMASYNQANNVTTETTKTETDVPLSVRSNHQSVETESCKQEKNVTMETIFLVMDVTSSVWMNHAETES